MSKDFGAAVSQAGTPIRYANDYQKVLDTRWRPVGTVIKYALDFTTESASGLYKIFDHNLGYIPAFEAPRQTDRLKPSPQSSPIGSTLFCADENSIYYVKFFARGKVKGYLYIYDFPINVPFDSEYKGTDLSTTSASESGIKIEGNNDFSTAHVGSDDNLGFSVNTNNKQISIAKVDRFSFVPDILGNTIPVYHNIPYPPLIKLSRKLVTADFTQIGVVFPKETWTSIGMSDIGVYSNAGTLYTVNNKFSGLANVKLAEFAYVIFRDPSEVAA